MRRPGEVRTALLHAACRLVPHEVRANPHAQRPTMREIAHAAQVSVPVAERTISNMARAGELRKVRTRPVDYVNKPVAEYEPVATLQQDADHRAGAGWVDLGRIMAGWAR